MDKTRGELIQDVRNMSQQLEHSREKLSRSRTERESNAAQRELEELRKLVRDREDEIGKLTADAETSGCRSRPPRPSTRSSPTELGAREGDISSKLTRSRESRPRSSERDASRQGSFPATLPALRDDPLQARDRHGADDRRHVQGLPHVASRRSSSTVCVASRSSSSARRVTASFTSPRPRHLQRPKRDGARLEAVGEKLGTFGSVPRR
jgi:hypothetical protein